MRIAVLDRKKCVRGKTCTYECIKYCPGVRMGQETIVKGEDGYPVISEELCSGCAICIKRCPYHAITIVKLPETLKEKPIHRFGLNAFELFRLPIPKQGAVVGILGRNGIGKTTALDILSGRLKPNFGELEKQPTGEDIIDRYSTTALGEYFKKLFSGEIRISYKPQRIELLPKVYKGSVNDLIKKVDEKGIADKVLSELGLDQIKNRKLSALSGGELQRLAICAAAVKDANFYYFDEPASFCDISHRMAIIKLVKSLVNEKTAVMIVEHDLTSLDYISDEIQVVYGKSGAYGVISQSKSTRRGINEYLDGYLPDDNVRFRDYAISFSKTPAERVIQKKMLFEFPELRKSFETFSLSVNPGEVYKGQVLAVVGANGLGKTTFLKMLAGLTKPDKGIIENVEIAYKPQYPSSEIEGTVGQWLRKIAGPDFDSPEYKAGILKKLGLDRLLNSEIKHLSGGELQKIHIAATLSHTAPLYAFDEPSAFIDVEDRLKVAGIIKDFISEKEAAAIVVDHDVQFIDFVGDAMLVFEGVPGKDGGVYGPTTKREGMDRVLKMLDITYRRDKKTNRPRINKPDSELDRKQRVEGNYYYA